MGEQYGRQKKIEATAYALLSEGATTREVANFITQNTGMNEGLVSSLVNDAARLAGTEVERDPELIRQQHFRRYKGIYTKNKDLYKEWIQFPQEPSDFAHNSAIIQCYRDTLRALSQIESLFDLGSKDAKELIPEVYFKEFSVNAVSENLIEKYVDYNELTVEQLVRFNTLMEKAMGVDQQEQYKAPDGSVEVRTSVVDPEDPMYSKEIDATGRENIVEYHIEKGTFQELEKERVNLGAKTLEDVGEALLNSLRSKAAKAYAQADAARTKKNKNVFVEGETIERKIVNDTKRINPSKKA